VRFILLSGYISKKIPPIMTEAQKPGLIVVAGPNGSGKTTITEKLLRHEWMEDCQYINPDLIAQQEFGDWNSPAAVSVLKDF
jgi:predicted ABC-type ATPase